MVVDASQSLMRRSVRPETGVKREDMLSVMKIREDQDCGPECASVPKEYLRYISVSLGPGLGLQSLR